MLAWHLSSEKVGRRVGVKGLMVLRQRTGEDWVAVFDGEWNWKSGRREPGLAGA